MRSYLWVCLCAFSMIANAQNCTATLSGKVIDFHDQTPLVGATIIIAGLEKSTLSDIDGLYSISGLCDGTYNLQVSHPECDTKPVLVTISGNTILNIKLEHHLEELGEVTIKAPFLRKV